MQCLNINNNQSADLFMQIALKAPGPVNKSFLLCLHIEENRITKGKKH